jgi:hypothetical protein
VLPGVLLPAQFSWAYSLAMTTLLVGGGDGPGGGSAGLAAALPGLPLQRLQCSLSNPRVAEAQQQLSLAPPPPGPQVPQASFPAHLCGVVAGALRAYLLEPGGPAGRELAGLPPAGHVCA